MSCLKGHGLDKMCHIIVSQDYPDPPPPRGNKSINSTSRCLLRCCCSRDISVNIHPFLWSARVHLMSSLPLDLGQAGATLTTLLFGPFLWSAVGRVYTVPQPCHLLISVVGLWYNSGNLHIHPFLWSAVGYI